MIDCLRVLNIFILGLFLSWSTFGLTKLFYTLRTDQVPNFRKAEFISEDIQLHHGDIDIALYRLMS